MAGPTLIQIKRSLNTAVPTLANGELGFTSNGDVLFIGANDVTIAIAGKRVLGVLTANQALVPNSISLLDTIKLGSGTANVVISATGIVLSNTDGEGNTVTITTPNTTEKGGNYYLKADGSWSTVTGATADPAGTNTMIQYNDSDVMGGSAGFTFLEDSNTVHVGTATVNATINATAFALANSTVSYSLVKPTAAQVSAANYYPASDSTWKQITVSTSLDALTDVVIASATNNDILVYDADAAVWENHAVGNGFSFDGQVLAVKTNAAGGINVDTNGIYLKLGATTSGLVVNSTGTWIEANSGLVANATGLHVGTGNGTAVDADAIRVLAGTDGGLISNVTGVWVASGNGLLTNSTGLHVGASNGISLFTDSVGVLGGSTLTVNSTGVHVNSALSIQDLTLAGNLTVSGTLTSLDVTNLTVTDPLIKLAEEQADTTTYTDTFDMGFVGEFGNTLATNTHYTGLFRDASDGIYKLFTGNIPAPTTTVDVANVNFTYSKLMAQLRTGTGTGLFEANNTGTTITANTTWAVAITANTLSLSTPLPGTSGGTGLGTIAEDSILVANATNGYTALALGTVGLVLQSNGTALVYDTLDGGTF